MMNRRLGNRSIWTIATALFLVAIVVPSVASASVVQSAGSTSVAPPQTWAYGALVWENYTALSSAYTESVRTYVGVQVISTIQNVSSTISEMNEVYTEAETYYVQVPARRIARPRRSRRTTPRRTWPRRTSGRT